MRQRMPKIKFQPKNILLCADDYAQNEAISEGILHLALNKRINAVSCMVTSPYWLSTHNEIIKIIPQVYIGLHLNFTFGEALSEAWKKNYGLRFRSYKQLLSKILLGQLKKEWVEAEIIAQLNVFIKVTGAPPDFIDGHEHIHQLPIIREVLIKIYKQKKLAAFLRNTCNGWADRSAGASFIKRLGISFLGGTQFKRLLTDHALPFNSRFAGIYVFKNAANYAYYFKHFLKKMDEGGLIMCHPGIGSNDTLDPLRGYRPYEFDYFMGKQFTIDLKNAQCQLLPKPSLNL